MLRRCAVLALVVLPALAHAQQPQFFVPGHFKTGEKPYLQVTSPVAARAIEAELNHDGQPVRLASGALRAGASVKLTLPGPGAYEGNIVVTFADGNRSTTPLSFKVAPTAPTGGFKVGYSKEHLDVAAHTLEFTASKPAAHAEITVIGEDGAEVATASVDYKGESPGTWLPIHWTPTRAGEVMKIDLRVTATDGSRVNVTLLPWRISVPHKEVVFETGKWDVRASEEPKLDAAYQKIADEVTRARKVVPDVPVRLYIAGFTDTVGNSSDNRKLSLERARAIAKWFRDRGLPLPIFYAGYGEDILRVQTPDNTDSEPNRRADYIVAFDEPRMKVRASWMKLQ
jgi:outer membrane protein OmpA-like peptidoglycan-associated protein